MEVPLITPKNRSPSTCPTQFRILVWKNYLLSIRNYRGTIGILITPILVCLILSSFQYMSDAVLTIDHPHPISTPISSLSKCIKTGSSNCTTLIYTPSVPWVDELMQTLCDQNEDLTYGIDVLPLPSSTTTLSKTWCSGNINHTVPNDQYISSFLHIPKESYIAKELEHGHLTYPCNWFQDNTTLQNYILARPNQTQTAIQFTSAYIDASIPTNIPGLPSLHLPTGYNVSVGYTLYYNATISKFPIRQSNHALETMRAVETAILSKRMNHINASITANYAKYPSPKPRLTGYDVVSQQGGIWFFLPGCIIFFSLFVELVTEKELKLKLGMQFMGMGETAYWASWVVSGLIFSILSTFILIGSGMICGYSTFINTDFSVTFVMYFCFNISMTGLAFFLAAVVNTRKAAQTIGYSFILVGFVFQTIICTGYGALIDLLFSNDVAWWVNIIRYFLQCYPPFSFAKSFFAISDIAGKQYHYSEGTVNPGSHFYWHNGTQTRHKHLLGHDVLVPPMFDSINLMVLDMAGFFIVAWWLDNVLESETGNSKPLLFCLKRSFCTCLGKNKNSFLSSSTKNISEDGAPALIVRDLVKEYGHSRCGSKSVRAVDGLSLEVETNSILCLLGHNGAGKSTTIGILTGLFPLTSGSAKLFGKDVNNPNDMASIQSLSGVCPQHDILWNELTAMEHAILFAHIKGVPANQVQQECEERLQFMGLTDVQHHRSSTFSGGMKRRLSVAMATISNPPFLVLDEPTTGMDPVNRRTCWKLIQKLKQNRLIVVTTHSMLEADVLGDQVGIMAHGKLECKGTPLAIKNEYGDGYTLSVVLKDGKDQEMMLTKGLNRVLATEGTKGKVNTSPELCITQRDGKAIKFTVPHQEVNRLPIVLRYLERIEGTIVAEWGVSDATLESAFLNVTEKSGFTYQSTQKNNRNRNIETKENTELLMKDQERKYSSFSSSSSSAMNNSSASSSSSSSSSWQSFTALLKKNFLLQSRQRCSSCCQIITPILVMLLLTLLQAIIRTQIPPSGAITVPAIPYPLNSPALASVITRGDQTEARGGRCLEFFNYSITTNNVQQQDVNQMLKHIPTRNCSLTAPWKNKIQVPYFNTFSNWTAMQKVLFQDLSILNQEPKSILEDINLPYPNFITPDGVLEFSKIDMKNYQFNFTFSINDADIALYHRPNGFTRLASRHASLFTDSVQLFDQGRMAMLSMMSDAFIEHVSSNSSTTTLNPLEKELIKTLDSIVGLKMASSMPVIEKPDLLGIVEVFGSFLYPMALTLQLPVYIFVVVLEKETRLRELQKSMGMQMNIYWCSSFTFNMILYISVAVFFWSVGIAVNLRFFTQTGFDLLFVFFILWGLALSSMSMLIASLISSRRIATVIGYVIVLFGNGIALILSDGIYGDLPDLSVSSRMPTWLLLNPQFAMVRFIYKANFRCAALLDCYDGLSALTVDDEAATCLFYLFFDAIWIMLLAIYLDQVVPSQWGVPKHFCFCFQNCRRKKLLNENHTETIVMEQIMEEEVVENLKHEDEDVTNERRMVQDDILNHGSSTASQFVVRTNNVRKEFVVQNDGQNNAAHTLNKIAVHSFTIGIQGGELFGLLGENGAGKTTFINMLVGTLTPTSGVASVAGCDIATEIDLVHGKTGICPQHDVLWDSLTVKEHLEFYANMKGVQTGAVLKQHVKDALIEVGLLKCQHRKSSQLSGGMKRRLSIAIAMIGNSEVVFLDEPTTGLDPASRRAIWKIIRNSKNVSNRCIIMTTHLMDEAESLCSRIGIMTQGRLRCVSGQQRLKRLYGGGYKVTVNYNEDKYEDVKRMILKGCGGGVQLINRFDGQSSWKLMNDGGVGSKAVSEVFEWLREQAVGSGVSDWALGQTSLDDVFAFIVGKYK